MPSQIDSVIERFESLDALFQALNDQTTPKPPYGGAVRIHPALLPEKALADYIAARRRLEVFGLRLVLTPAVAPGSVELRGYTRPSCEPAGTAAGAVPVTEIAIAQGLRHAGT